ncbi:hypothetical protein [Paenibacillus durus]|uniref:Uncharacterized protein n=1 Tax=Paenibacillus durus TaxID=44251 RepID=A0A089HKG1_PAEDU|nr:hypothetical protein [Paenibacillus durus]AIQ11185.1 hypothetical protein PDUR_03615 [Paenibacillus durus]
MSSPSLFASRMRWLDSPQARLTAATPGGPKGSTAPCCSLREVAAGLAPGTGADSIGARPLLLPYPAIGEAVMKRKFGAGEATAFAFMLGFQPLSGSIRKSEHNSDRKPKCLS